MISHLTEDRKSAPPSVEEEPENVSGVGLVVDEDGNLLLALSSLDDGAVDFWTLNAVEAKSLAKMILAVLD